MQKQSYFFWADVVRILAIYLVVVVHTTVFSQTPSSSIFHLFSFAMAKTSVPLFIMLSGALLLQKKEPYALFFRKRMSRIILPWIVWSIIYFLFLLGIHEETVASFSSIFKGFIGVILGYWYLPMIVSLYCLTPPLRTFVHTAKYQEIAFVIFIWFITISFLPFLHNTLAFPLQSENSLVKQVLFYIGYFIFGYLCTITTFPKHVSKYAIFLFFIGICLTVLVSLQSQSKTIDLTFYEYVSPTIVLTSGALFVFIYTYLHKRFFSPKIPSLIHFISKTTYGVFFLHIIVIKVFTIPQIGNLLPLFKKSSSQNEFLLGSVYFIISVIIITLIQKIPGIKRAIT